jgi:uncharacterized protein YggT (Ycf19 family)
MGAGGFPQSAGARGGADHEPGAGAPAAPAACHRPLRYRLRRRRRRARAGAPLLRAGELAPLPTWGLLALFELLRTILWTFFFSIFLYALLSLIAPGTYSPAQSMLASLAEPVLRPFRRIIPPLGGLDLSPLWAIILIQALLILLH